ncbi:HIT family protein [Mycolicibacterium komossense]|uniref:HIT family protein n=1 Tax=Mycolicibacterium komossense TaxID=1779 RepID=A0ABT3C5H8_9MYCO|nr:HIT family protein [Mycolicibacterium komossense]MCV7224670.1 HIT family protein [Mycolicibacterium komossense]
MSRRESAIELPEGDDCAFCDYLSGRRPYTVLWREDQVAVLVTREQRGIGHLLVLPNRHVPSLLHLFDGEAEAMMVALRDAAITIDSAYKRPGVAVWQNNGVAAHQAIPHLHFHVAGTLPGGGTDFGDVPELSVDATDVIGHRLASFVPQRPHSGRRVNSELTNQTLPE